MQDVNQNMEVPKALIDAYLFRLPRSYKYEGYIWPGIVTSLERLQQMKDFKFYDSDIIIASYPKSGTTWVSEIVSLICHHGDVTKVKQKPLHERVPWLELDQGFMWVRFFWIWQVVTKLFGIVDPTAADGPDPNVSTCSFDGDESFGGKRRVFFTHLPLELLPTSAIEGKCKIIYVSRNPKDNAVSFFHFHQMARLLGQQRMSWDDFFALYTVGQIYCGSWFEHVMSFYEYSQIKPNRVMFLKYEDMKKDLTKEVGNIAAFLDELFSENTIDRIVEHCQFESMKSNRMTNREGVWLFNQKVSNFMRKGTVGDWKNYFTVTQNEIFDALYERKVKGTGLSYDFDL